MHTVISGMTLSGKTTLAKRLCRWYKSKGVESIVYDPQNSDWPTPFVYSDGNEFWSVLKASSRCVLFIDDSGSALARDKKFDWLAKEARHPPHLHKSIFLMQRGADVTPSIRGNCEHLFLFKSDWDACKTWAQHFVQKELLDASQLDRFEFFKTNLYWKYPKKMKS